MTQLLDDMDRAILWSLEDGLPPVSRPYLEVGKQLGICEEEVIARLRVMTSTGVIKRFGVVVRHHEVGYGANAMVVWDVPDESLRGAVDCMTASPHVTLCYQRPRRLPDWPYNLFCMIHGKDEKTVRGHIELLRSDSVLADLDHDVLFSRRRFKQSGARYQPGTSEPVKREVA